MRWRAAWGVALGVLVGVPGVAQAQGVLAYPSSTCDTGTDQCPFGLFVMADDGSSKRRLTSGRDLDPDWSPAGDRIAFSRTTTEGYGYERLFVANADGSNERQLIPGGMPGATSERSPSWSAGGDAIAFQANVTAEGTYASIYVVGADGSGPKRVSREGQTALSPLFAPDGVHIVYFGYMNHPIPGPDGRPQDYGMWITDRLGSEPRRVTAGDLPIASNGASFSPSGLYMAVTLVIEDQTHVYAMRSDGSGLRRIEGAMGTTPEWSGVGDAIFYEHGSNAFNQRLYRLDLKVGATPKPLTDPGSTYGRSSWSALGRFTTELPPVDELAPLTIVGDLPGAVGDLPGKLPFLAADISGIKHVEGAVGLRVAKRCRFLRSDGRLGSRRSCGRPVYSRVPLDSAGWQKRTKRLPKGTYDVRFKATDTRGNTTRKPKRRVVRVR